MAERKRTKSATRSGPPSIALIQLLCYYLFVERKQKMADFNIKVNDEAFRQLGVKPVFDENLYGKLIDAHAQQQISPLDVVVTPSALWSGRSLLHLSQRLQDIYTGNAVLPVGGYSGSEQSIVLPANSDPARTTKLLLHETKHYIDHMNGNSEESAALMKLHLRGAVALAGAGVLLGAVTGKKGLAVASALSPLATLPTAYWKAPHEVAARQFADDKDIQDDYGKVITYKSL